MIAGNERQGSVLATADACAGIGKSVVLGVGAFHHDCSCVAGLRDACFAVVEHYYQQFEQEQGQAPQLTSLGGQKCTEARSHSAPFVESICMLIYQDDVGKQGHSTWSYSQVQ